MQDLIRALLAALGEDPAREGLLQTPRRVEQSLRTLTSGYAADIDAVILSHAGGNSQGSVRLLLTVEN